MSFSRTNVAPVNFPFEAMKQQRLAWGAAFAVGVFLIFFEGAPIIPVVAGCVLVPLLTAVLSSRRRPKSR
jgi:hypothetical protein